MGGLFYHNNLMTNATPKQKAFIESLLAGRVVDADRVARIRGAWDRITVGDASDIIGVLLSLPVKASSPVQPHTAMPEVPAGRYALDSDHGVKFYHVQKPVDGKWAGYVFVHVQAGDDLFPIKNRESRAAILKEIAENPQAAMIRYGREIGRCGHCGRTLTDDDSRAAGIGPICASKMGF